MSTSYKRIGAVLTAFEILDVIREHRAVTSRLISERLSMSESTLMCYLSTFVDLGVVSVDGDKYRIGVTMAAFWASVREKEETDFMRAFRNLSAIGALPSAALGLDSDLRRNDGMGASA